MFCAYGRSLLVRIYKTLNQLTCIDILQNHVLPFKNTHCCRNLEYTYQLDWRGPHRAKKFAAFLNANRVDVLPWSAQSSDLNFIENVWGIMKRPLRMLYKYPPTADALFEELCKIWNELSDDYLVK